MMYKRKTRDYWELHVNYGQGFEYETAEETRKDAIAQKKCYRKNCPEYPVKIVKKRERI